MQMEPNTLTKDWIIARLYEIAAAPPETTRGNLTDQIKACRTAYCQFGYEPALGRLREIADIDAARTKGQRRHQESAEKLLKRLLSSIKVDKTQGIQ